MRNSPLWKALGATSSIFQVWNSSTGTYSDDDIVSFTVTKGDDTAAPGISVNTAEAEITADVSNIVGARSRINLTAYGANLVAKMAGNVTPPQIQERFWGRTGIVSINDVDNDFRTTSIASSGWLAVVKKSKYSPAITRGMKTGLAIMESLKFQNLAEMYTPRAFGVFDTILQNPEKTNFSELVKIYADPTGLQVREVTGSREIQVRTIEARKQDVIARKSYAPHLTRSAAISPARHSQTTDMFTEMKRYLTINSNGTPETLSCTPTVDRTFWDVSEEDLTYIRRTTQQIEQHIKSVEHKVNKVSVRPESIKIDIILLLTSESEHHRHQAGYILALQAGDPVFFSYDWQDYIRGVYFAQQIKETVTPESWVVELSLYPASHIVGDDMMGHNTPPQTWEAAGVLRWNSPEIASTRWNEA